MKQNNRKQIEDFTAFLKDYYQDKEGPFKSEKVTKTIIKLMFGLNECIGQASVEALPSVSKLCKAAHCSRTTFYQTFTNVEGLLEMETNIYLHVQKKLIIYLIQRDDERLRQTLRLCIKRVLLTPQLLFFCFAQRQALTSRTRDLLVSIIGNEDKRIEQCLAILAGLLFIQFSVLRMDNQMSNEEKIDFAEAVCYDYLLREPFFPDLSGADTSK